MPVLHFSRGDHFCITYETINSHLRMATHPDHASAKYDSSESLSGLQPFWHALEQAVPSTPMQHFIWSNACLATLPTVADIAVHVVATGPRTGAIAPLVKVGRAKRSMEILGFRYLFEPSDFLFSDVTALRELASSLVASGTPLFLERIPADSPTVAAITEAYRGRGATVVRAAPPYPRILLDESWRDPLQHLNAGRRSDLRRSIRHAEKLGEVTYQILSPSPDDLESLLEEAYEVEAANWKGGEGSALAVDEVRGRFFRHYASLASKAGSLRLCFLRIGNRAVATQIAVECQGGFWLFKIGYRDEFAKCSPGMLLIAETIRYSANKGLTSYEFLGSTAEWTRVWTKNEHPCVSVRAYPFGLTGITALVLDAAIMVWQRLRRVMKDRILSVLAKKLTRNA